MAILDYTGFFAFDDPPFPQQSVAAMRERFAEHQAQYPEAVAFFNTDGFNRRYAPTTCSGRLDEYVSDVRHGWWEGLTGGVDLSRFPLEWAQRTYDLSRETQVGSLHFLNWTTAKSSMEDLSGGSW